jgi:hypothetical protein
MSLLEEKRLRVRLQIEGFLNENPNLRATTQRDRGVVTVHWKSAHEDGVEPAPITPDQRSKINLFAQALCGALSMTVVYVTTPPGQCAFQIIEG